LEVIGPEHVLFASELLGAVPNQIEPETGRYWDDTRRYIEQSKLTKTEQQAVFEDNARAVYPHLDAKLNGQQR
jgi:4-oxalmesaconate hydratase